MRVLVLTHEYPPVGGGGARVIQDLCQGLARRGHELRVLTMHLDDLMVDEEIEGVRVYRLPCQRKVPFQARFGEMARYVISGFGRGLALMRDWQPAVMHVHFAVPAGALGWALKRVTGVPYILTAHGGDVPGGAPEKTAGWFRWVYPFTPMIWRSAARVAAVSEQTRHLALRHYPVEICVIRNGFNIKTFQTGSIEVGYPPRVIWAGRFMPEKNPVQVVRTLAELKHLDWSCVMIGDGPERARVEQAIAHSGLEGRFIVPGWLPQDEVISWFNRSDVLFMPSFMEGLPIVGLQGLALGLAIVATRVGGFLDLVVPGQNGYLVDPADGSGYSAALGELLQNRDLLQSFRAGSRQVSARFDIDSMVQAYDQLLFEVGASDANEA